MPDGLMIKPMGAMSSSIEEVCRQQGVRLKEVNSFSIANEWLTLRTFDVVFVHSAYAESDRDEFAGLVWKKSPLTYFVLFNLEDENLRLEHNGLLAGYEVASGKGASALVLDVIKRTQTLKGQSQEVPEIMVVEDLESPRDIICSYVEALGTCKASGVASATAALEGLEATPDRWACIITDIRMPKIDGRQMIELIRQHPKLQHIPIIVLTAYGTLDTLIDCLRAGASGFMVKPPRKQDLIREIARALRIREHRQSPRLASEADVDIIQEELLRKHGGDML